MNDKRRTYLGDGAYAEDDGIQVRLYCRRDGIEHEVFLGPSELDLLLKFVKTLGWSVS